MSNNRQDNTQEKEEDVLHILKNQQRSAIINMVATAIILLYMLYTTPSALSYTIARLSVLFLLHSISLLFRTRTAIRRHIQWHEGYVVQKKDEIIFVSMMSVLWLTLCFFFFIGKGGIIGYLVGAVLLFVILIAVLRLWQVIKNRKKEER